MEFPQAADLLLQRGSIFHGDLFHGIDHGKFFAVVGEDGNDLIGAFFINSEINTNVIQVTSLALLSCRDMAACERLFYYLFVL